MKKIFLLFYFFISSPLFAQTLINVYPFPRYNPYNYFWGITHRDNDLWIATDFDGTGYPFSMMYRVTKSGVILDSVTSPFKFNHGLAWDGGDFLWAEDYRSAGARVFRVSSAGVKLDSITLPTVNGGAPGGIGDIEIVENYLWFTVYAPDFPTYPNAYAYKLDLGGLNIIDTIPLYGRQPQGITVKGDTIFYVNDNFQGAERIYAYRKAVGDTIFSFPVPDPDSDCNPRGLHWDGEYLWLIADRVGGSVNVYKALYKYDLRSTGTPILTVQNTLSFGDVIIGAPQNLNLPVFNTGNADLKIDSITINNHLFTYSPTNTPHFLSPGQSKIYTVTFNPSQFGNQTAQFTIYSNDPVASTRIVQLSGRGVFGLTHINFSSQQLDFGGKRINSTSSLFLTIYNQGTQILRVDSLVLYSQNFYLKDYSPPINILYTDSAKVRVWFKPANWLNYIDTIKVYSNAANGAIKSIILRGHSAPYDSTLGGIMWTGTTPDNPNTISDDYTARYIKRIGDINGDGFDDIIVTTDDYLTVAYNGNSSGTADILWIFNTAPNNNNTGKVDYNQALQIIDDISGDGINDVAIGTGGGSESVIAINGVTGELIWEYGDPINYNNGDVWALDVKRDFNGDGKKDILASISGNEITGQGRFSVYLLDGTNGNIIWQINQAPEWKLKYAITSTDNGGAVGSRIAGQNAGQVIGFDKFGNIIWTFNTTASPWGLIEIPDLNGDSKSDIIAGGFDGKVYALTGDSGRVMWQTSIGSYIIEDLFLSPDVDGDAMPDILVSALTSNGIMISGKTGSIIWTGNTGGNNLGAGVLGDLTGDFILEMGVASLSNLVKVFNGATGQDIFTYSFGPGTNPYAAECVWQMDDLDRNGSLEFAAGSRDGRIVAFSGGLFGTIPVELTLFTAVVDNNNVILSWTTASELNNKGFSIQRREDKNDFIDIGFINGKGTITSQSNYSFIDKNLNYGTYIYRLIQIDFDGKASYSKDIEVNISLPIKFSLEQNYPNPFNPSTTIRYSLPIDSKVKLLVYNILGEKVATLVDEFNKAGYYEINWNGTNNRGNLLPSGIYIYRIETEKYRDSKKMILMK